MNGPSDMLSHGALVRPYSFGHCCVVPSRGISWHLLALATDFSSIPFSLSPLFSLLCATAQLLVQLENPLYLRLSLRILFSARKLIQIVALCNSFPPPPPPLFPLLLYTVIIIIITICTKSFRQLPISLSRFVPAQQWPARAF